MLTPSSNTALEPLTSAMLGGLPEVSAHFGRFKVTGISLDPGALGQFDDVKVLEAARLLADGKALIDYVFHLIVTDPSETVLREELPCLIREGYTSFKIYMTYDELKLNDREILDVLAVARVEGAMVMVHAENADCIEWLTRKLEAAGRTAPRYYAQARPMLVEREATQRAIALSELVDVPILIVHVSGREARMQPAAARTREPAGDLGRACLRRVPGVLLGPRPVPLRRRARQEARRQGSPVPPYSALPAASASLQSARAG
jgi:hypothetical protein